MKMLLRVSSEVSANSSDEKELYCKGIRDYKVFAIVKFTIYKFNRFTILLNKCIYSFLLLVYAKMTKMLNIKKKFR